ncbi:efflux RND transporter permease subunit [Legionella sp. WA2022007384]
MALADYAIKNKTVTSFILVLFFIAGSLCFFQLGRLEDPEFTVKTATITTHYPGASAEQVELEVTDRIEKKIQEMSEVKDISSISRAGLSIIKVNIKNEYWSDRLPQVWDTLRKKVDDIQNSLPPGAEKPVVGDDFGYVFGFLLAVTSDGFNYAELENYTKEIQKELSIVPGVARVDLWGVQQKRIYLNVSNTQLSQLEVTLDDLERTLKLQNQVVDAGHVNYQLQRLRIAPTGEFNAADAIGDLAIIPKFKLNEQPKKSEEIIRIRDFAEVKEGYIDPPEQLMRYSGLPAIGIALAPLPGVNAVKVGQDVDKRLNEIQEKLPRGIEIHKISWQSDIVAESINAFIINLVEAVVIVLLVLAFTMGMRAGMIIGVSGLILAILGTFIVMKMLHIDLQRVSLGALIIAMGMMVDNAIVVVDGFITRLQQGKTRQDAAIEAAQISAWPLLGATIVASMAFFPIFASTYDTGEYAGSLFTVIAVSLILSWVFSQTATPLLCILFMPDPKQVGEGAEYTSRFYKGYKFVLEEAVRYRLFFSLIMCGLLVLSIICFRFVPIMYFPDSSRLQVMIDYWAPEGTRIEVVSKDLEQLEKKLLADPGVTSVSTFIGQGPPRFYLPVESEFPYSSYAQLIVNMKSLKDVDRMVATLPAWNSKNYPQSMVRVRKYAVGAFNNWKIAARFSGPANANPAVLRDLADQAVAILRNNQNTIDVRTDWREPVLQIVPDYHQERARWANISRLDLAQALQRASDGVTVGLYREQDNLIPIILRQPLNERDTAAVDLPLLQVNSQFSTKTIPVSQVVNDIKLAWTDPIIWRWDRKRAITVQCSPYEVTANTLRESILPQFEKIKLPPGYTLTWDGEYKSSRESADALKPGLFPAVVIMVLIIVMLFNAYRPPLIIIAVIPFAMIGITFGLLLTGVPFGFIALLGAMSLSGMMIKNSVVLLDQVNINRASGMTPYDAVISAGVSRLSPVVNAAVTTILGVIPLLQDIFWVSLAVTIMFGLTIGTILTMFLVPAFYCILYRIDPKKEQ